MKNKPAHWRIDENEDATHSWDKCREGDCIRQCGYNATTPGGFSFEPELFTEANKIQISVMVEAGNEDEDNVKELVDSINWGKVFRDKIIQETRKRREARQSHLSREVLAGLHCKTEYRVE